MTTKKAPGLRREPSSASPSVSRRTRPPAERELVRINAQIPPALHRRVKAGCAAKGISITDMLIEVLEARFPKP